VTTATYWTADDLLAYRFPPPRFAVPGLLCEGLNVIIGAPKIGKSYLSLGIGIAVSTGGRALGTVPCDPGPVLYLALEDTPRRLQARLRQMLAAEAAPGSLAFATEWPTLPDGGADRIDRWLCANPGARLVIVDTLAKIRGRVGENGNAYHGDYAAIAALKAVADRHAVCMVVIHHDRKAGGEDFVDRVSGTHGIAGAADALLVISRERNTSRAVLEITGRDVEEARHELTFSPEVAAWTLLDTPASAIGLSEERRRIWRRNADDASEVSRWRP
jgi:RecA-family ATPase